jgi:hypothetical protein
LRASAAAGTLSRKRSVVLFLLLPLPLHLLLKIACYVCQPSCLRPLLHVLNCCIDAEVQGATKVYRMAKKKKSKAKTYVPRVVVPRVGVQQNTAVPAAKVVTAPVVQQIAPVAKGTIAPALAPPAVAEKKAPVPEVKLPTAPVKVENKKAPVAAAKLYTAPVATDFRMPVP